MNFNLVSTLLAVSSAHDTVHIFKLWQQQKSGASSLKTPSSPSESLDSREGQLDGGYDAYVDKKRNGGVSYVPVALRAPLVSDVDLARVYAADLRV